MYNRADSEPYQKLGPPPASLQVTRTVARVSDKAQCNSYIQHLLWTVNLKDLLARITNQVTARDRTGSSQTLEVVNHIDLNIQSILRIAYRSPVEELRSEG